ncbi:MAG: site-specific tyrosine recombinase XerD [Actinomycetota bacterium]
MTGLAGGIDEYLSALAVERGLAANTVSAYRRDLRQYLTFLEGVDPAPADNDRYVVDLHDRGLAPASIARKLAALRGLHRFLVDEGRADSDPTRLLETPRRPEPFPKALPIDEVIRLLEAPDPATVAGRRDRAMLEFLYGTGARVSEAVDLDVAAVDLEGRSAILTGKGDRQRLVPLGGAAINSLRDWLPDRLRLARPGPSRDALFLNLRGGRISRQSVFRMIRQHAELAGIDPARVSPHTLRHSAATHMVEGGADLRSIQVLLGHARISTTQVYTRVSPQHLVEVFLLSHPRSR